MTFDRQAARARCEAATEGPWEWNDSSDVRGHKGELKAPSPTNGFMLVSAFVNSADGPFIAHARTDLPLALDELDEKDAEIERLRGALLPDLSKEEVERRLEWFSDDKAYAATLREYRDIVRAVGEMDLSSEEQCPFCDEPNSPSNGIWHEPDCTYLRARRVMGEG